MEPTQSSETSAYNVRTPGKHPEDNFSLLQHGESLKTRNTFIISNFRHVLYVVCFLLRDSPPSEFYMPTFRNTLSVPSSQASRYLPMKMEQTECSEMSAYEIQMPGNYPEENIQQKLSPLDILLTVHLSIIYSLFPT